VCKFSPPNLNLLPRTIVMSVKCNLFCVKFYIEILYLLDSSQVKMVTVGLQSFPHYETDDRAQLQFSAKLSVSLRDESVKTVNYVYVSFCSYINPPLLLTPDSLVTTYQKDSENNNYIILSAILFTMWHRLIILQGKPY
jgi:hypothetical protein